MSRRAARFTEADAVRGAKAAKRAGVSFEIMPDGTFRFIPTPDPALRLDGPPPPADLDRKIELW